MSEQHTESVLVAKEDLVVLISFACTPPTSFDAERRRDDLVARLYGVAQIDGSGAT